MAVQKKLIVILVALMISGLPSTALSSLPVVSNSPRADYQLPGLVERRVNAPYNVPASEAAVLWFGQVTLAENYADVRILYTDESLIVHLGIMDRLLWYDTSPSPSDLTSWDSVSLYLSQNGNVGEIPGTNAYRFDAQLAWWESDRTNFQAAYRGDGSGWVIESTPFTTAYGWNGNAPNDDTDDRGWNLFYTIPFVSLGLDSPPSPGTVWGLGLAVHDRDSAIGPPLADQVWPEAMAPEYPDSWGELAFGTPPPYAPPASIEGGTLVLRQDLGGVTVVDADVGGSSVCGDTAAPDFFPTWGELNYTGKEFLNIQHVGQISEWPCYSKYYVTFPLDALPDAKIIISATLTLYQFGNAGEGWDPGPQPSYIEVLTVNENWEEPSLTWNNAPLAVENVAASWVDPLDVLPPWPGIPRTWDVSEAVARAYAAAESLRLALYSPDWPFHSGKYFFSSDIGGDGEGRPTLTVNWGEPVAQIEKAADTTGVDYGDTIKYFLRLRAMGTTLTLTDTLPSAVEWTGDVMVRGTEIVPVYDQDHHLITWEDNPALGEQVFITYTASVNTFKHELLVNVAELVDQEGHANSASSIVIANPHRCYLPLLRRP